MGLGKENIRKSSCFFEVKREKINNNSEKKAQKVKRKGLPKGSGGRAVRPGWRSRVGGGVWKSRREGGVVMINPGRGRNHRLGGRGREHERNAAVKKTSARAKVKDHHQEGDELV